jgi:hypothetical protein
MVSWYDFYEPTEDELDGGVIVTLLNNLRVKFDII